MQIANGIPAYEIKGVTWQKGSASIGDGNCVEVSRLPGGGIAMRNSRFPEGPALVFTSMEMEVFVKGAKDAEFDHLMA
ncbi:DUF397 domain-containing protein [Streptomyces sp. G7(2002)]|uniref:DUF397 domain-containing protein n=1 Tax=Streptomyces sp. G7(2002) TaxID=2971798 RepID=UPI00237D77A9|nr:DUF397 domain-containing protein [Streptomyces sp. G7(2002)]WDT58527.1 DUF397 domain-containing protein [Streptomyces sp. G7(2002)]